MTITLGSPACNFHNSMHLNMLMVAVIALHRVLIFCILILHGSEAILKTFWFPVSLRFRYYFHFDDMVSGRKILLCWFVFYVSIWTLQNSVELLDSFVRSFVVDVLCSVYLVCMPYEFLNSQNEHRPVKRATQLYFNTENFIYAGLFLVGYQCTHKVSKWACLIHQADDHTTLSVFGIKIRTWF